MKRFLVCVFLILMVLLARTSSVHAQQQYATCDQCGLCIDNDGSNPSVSADSNLEGWKLCQPCLYPKASADYTTFETLKVDYDTNELVYVQTTPFPGHYYTGIGCITTNLADFSEPGAAAGLVRPLLNVLLSVGGGIAFIYLLYGAFLVVTSRADPEQLSQGKRTIYGAIIGIVFAMSSVFLINLIANGILKIPGFGK